MTATVVCTHSSGTTRKGTAPAPANKPASGALPPVSAGLVDELFSAEKGQRDEERAASKAA